jgi:MarR family transcriptional regulator, organic hydroperoxide resistance regulator
MHGSRLTAEQIWLLRFLERQCPGNVGALAEALGITPSSATTACKRLEQAGLVTRTRQATDERVVLVDLTAQGRAHLDEMRRRQGGGPSCCTSALRQKEPSAVS